VIFCKKKEGEQVLQVVLLRQLSQFAGHALQFLVIVLKKVPLGQVVAEGVMQAP